VVAEIGDADADPVYRAAACRSSDGKHELQTRRPAGERFVLFPLTVLLSGTRWQQTGNQTRS
jgi:hypothetical protein